MGKRNKKNEFFNFLPEPAEDILCCGDADNDWLIFTDNPTTTEALYEAINKRGVEADEEARISCDQPSASTPSGVTKSLESEVPSEEGQETSRSSRSGKKYVGQYEIAEYLANHFSAGLFQEVPYVKVNGVHTPLTKQLVGKLIEKSVPEFHIKNGIRAKQFEEIRDWLHVLLDNEEHTLKLPKRTILFENGTFNVSGKRTTPKDTDFFPVQLNASYYPDMKPDTPVFDKFLEDSAREDEEVKRLILTFLGYMISPGSGKHLLLMGPASDSGKSVLVNWCRRLLGKGNTCAISIHNFTKSFEVAQLLGKSANFCADISGSILNEATVAALKRLSGRDLETLNAKYRDPFPYENFAKMVFCCNNGGVRLRTPDEGFANRLTVIPFLFSVPKSAQDSELEEKLWAERDGIVYHAMKALREYYYPEERFPYCRVGEALKAKWLCGYDTTVRSFIEDRCELTAEEKIWTRELYEQYQEYCQDMKIEALSFNHFSRCMHSIPTVQAKKFQRDGIQLQGLFGIGLKDGF